MARSQREAGRRAPEGVRRAFAAGWALQAGALLPLAALLVVGCASAPAPGDPAVEDLEVNDGPTALRVLMEGNERFVDGVSRHDHESPSRRLRVVEGQHPFGIVLGCADSRVPPELLFDIGLGDLFVIRVAGNVGGTDEFGSIEYAMAHLHTHLVMVLGHESCGAVTAVVEPPEGEEPRELEHLLHAVRDAVGEVDSSKPLDERVHHGVEANVLHQVKLLAEIRARVQGWRPKNERVLIVGAVYELDSGRVRVLETL